MATEIKGSELGQQHVGKLYRMDYRNAVGMDLSVYELTAVGQRERVGNAGSRIGIKQLWRGDVTQEVPRNLAPESTGWIHDTDTIYILDRVTADMPVPTGATTPSGMAIVDCQSCGLRHPVGRAHCGQCGAPSAFLDGNGNCLKHGRE